MLRRQGVADGERGAGLHHVAGDAFETLPGPADAVRAPTQSWRRESQQLVGVQPRVVDRRPVDGNR